MDVGARDSSTAAPGGLRRVTWIKICGITSCEDAELCLDLGADALGVNLIATSRRYVDPAQAGEIARVVKGRGELVLVVANENREVLARLLEQLDADWLQLHGHEDPATVGALAPKAYKAVRIAEQSDIALALQYPGPRLLVDALVEGELGGTGTTFDWSLVTGVVTQRHLILAGGLTPDNVRKALVQVGPWGVDVASGVESAQVRRKDPGAVRAFIEAVRSQH